MSVVIFLFTLFKDGLLFQYKSSAVSNHTYSLQSCKDMKKSYSIYTIMSLSMFYVASK